MKASFKVGLALVVFGIIVGLLPGCASTDVLDIGGGSYSLTAQAHASCPAGAREEAVEAAKDYCDHVHQKPHVMSFDDKVFPARCTSSIVFRCD